MKVEKKKIIAAHLLALLLLGLLRFLVCPLGSSLASPLGAGAGGGSLSQELLLSETLLEVLGGKLHVKKDILFDAVVWLQLWFGHLVGLAADLGLGLLAGLGPSYIRSYLRSQTCDAKGSSGFCFFLKNH